MSQCKPLLRTGTTPRLSAAIPSRGPTPSFTQARHESTTRRHKKLLHVQQAPSYAPSTPRAPTLIFNPPSAQPSVYHTPLKFLPPSDRRRNLYTAFEQRSAQSALAQRASPIASPGTPLSTTSALPPRPTAALPPAVRSPYEKKYHLDAAAIEQMRALRAQDPDKWTRARLAEKFGCSQFFVGMVAKAPEKAEKVAREHEDARARWGRIRREAREDRGRRKALWGRDA